ncbi:3-dehydroquinate synthase [Buchnera aphidicola (Ceratovacuna keduensis)]|uniref:3-dehydroquinate synthase n=1 Tax=Buchnera aphidicola TaxID=9 RepID=UPI0031B8B148
METLKISLNKKKYYVNIGYNIINNKDLVSKLKIFKNSVLITNTTIYKIYKNNVINNFKRLGIINKKIILQDGEIYKTFDSVQLIIEKLIKLNCGRNITLISFGGGVIGDITGFVSSIYKRGIKYINIPTTLLSQVDASIGGKTGVNNHLSKNVIGTFYHPEIVIIDLMFLRTLPKKEIISGFSEIIKYSILFDKNFFYWIKNNLNNILFMKKNFLLKCIKKSCEFKIKIISEDEKEKNSRMLLNLGHTFGHAIESFTKYKWSHGESVSSGIVMSSIFSNVLGKISSSEVNEIINLFKLIGLPTIGPKNMYSKDYLKYMLRDKKNICNKKVRLIIPEKIGRCVLLDNVDTNILIKVINKNFIN